MIESKNISRYYGDYLAVDQISFQIKRGEVVGLLGHNGAGKTTIMKMLTGYLDPSHGQVLIDGMDMLSNRDKLQSTIGYLPENCPLYPEMTVTDYLLYIGSLKNMNSQEARQQLRYVLEQTDIGSKALDRIDTLSRGFKQRVGVAQAILNQPDILILDEPTNGLDPSQIQHMRDLILKLAERSTIIISTHIMQEVQAICDRVIMIKQGKLALDSSLESIDSQHSIQLITDAGTAFIRRNIADLSGVDSFQNLIVESDFHGFELALDSAVDVRQLMADIARIIVEGGFNLYELKSSGLDLECLFKEVVSGDVRGGLNRAA